MKVASKILGLVLVCLIIGVMFGERSALAGEVKTIRSDTDSSWKCLDAEVDGWASVGFDNSWWPSAEELFYIRVT